MSRVPPTAEGLSPAEAVSLRARTLVHQGRAEEALTAVRDAQEQLEIGPWDRPTLHYAVAVAHRSLGQAREMTLAADACLAAARGIENAGWTANALNLQAMSAIRDDDVDAALAGLARAENALAATTDPVLAAWARNGLGYCYTLLRLYEIAVPHMELPLPTGDPRQPPMAAAIQRLNLAWLHHRWAGDIERAAPEDVAVDQAARLRETANEYAREALAMSTHHDHPIMAEIRAVELVTRPPHVAVASIDDLRALWAEADHADHVGSRPTVGCALARALWEVGDRDEAMLVAQEAARMSETTSDWQVTADAQWLCADLAAQAGIPGADASRAYGLTLSRVLWRQRLATLHGAMAAREVEAMQHRLEAAQQAATSDPLTGLANRRALEGLLARTSGGAPDVPTSLLLIDLDGFKAVNDEHGHRVGDQVLRAVGTAITDVARRGDLVVRLGGDEFVVVAVDADARQAAMMAERVREAVAATTVSPPGGGQVGVTASVGSRTTGPDLATGDLLHAADEAMYQVKRGHASVGTG